MTACNLIAPGPRPFKQRASPRKFSYLAGDVETQGIRLRKSRLSDTQLGADNNYAHSFLPSRFMDLVMQHLRARYVCGRRLILSNLAFKCGK